MRDLCDGSDVIRLRAEAMPGFIRVTSQNLTGTPHDISIAMSAPNLEVLSSLPPVHLPAWGEVPVVVAYESRRASLLQLVAVTWDGQDSLLTRAAVPVPVAASKTLAHWGQWVRASAWIPPTRIDSDVDSRAIARVLECFGVAIPVDNLPPEYDAAWACVAIPALVAVGPVHGEFFTADPALARRCATIGAAETPSRRRALVQVGIAIAKIFDYIDINWELADILTVLGDLGRLLPQAGVPASAISPLVQLLSGVSGQNVGDLDTSARAALSRGLGQLERLAAGGGPTGTSEAVHE